MTGDEVIRLADAIHREKNISLEIIFGAIEVAIAKAAAKNMELEVEPHCEIDRETGEANLWEVDLEEIEEPAVDPETGEPAVDPETGEPVLDEETGKPPVVLREIRHILPDRPIAIDPLEMGRVAAQTAKQVIIQRLREAERDVVFEDFEHRKREIIVGTVQRIEGQNLIVHLGKTEGFFPRWEQVADESYDIGDRVRALILDVKKVGQKVKITLSRTHPDFVRRLFELEIPEVSEHVIEIKGLVREPGFRSKVAVYSLDAKVDCVGACVGVRGSRIKGIIDELGGEKIDIIRWAESPEVLLMNSLKPAQISSITLDYEKEGARVCVPDDQLSLAIGKRGQNVRLASRLTGWRIDIITQTEERQLKAKAVAKFNTIPEVDELLANRLFNAGFTTFDEVLEAGPDAIVDSIEGVERELAVTICDWLENVDEEEYYREVEYEMPEDGYTGSRAAVDALFGDVPAGAAPEAPPDGKAPASFDDVKSPKSAAELFGDGKPQAEAKPDADADTTPDADADTTPDADADTTPDADADADTTPDADADAKPEAEADATKASAADTGTDAS